ncbi:hypothetical protein DFH07DRAFT_547667 [Mycena maculata]|uniref:Uncharacterized protein n=1 Tax=Mycena maculata TaxID=230809 RepID=A0AAD7IWY5_9AGAR|nr:hypothetical protein DFH07DRAFT_547667 [Mycena maculata]
MGAGGEENTPSKFTTVWVSPRSTAARDTLFPLPLPGTDRVNFEIALTTILPGPVDRQRAIHALHDALAFYPHASGRLRKKGDDWALGAGKRGVPITFTETDEPLSHYQYPADYPAHIIDTISSDILGASEPEFDEPMMRIKVTFCRTSNETYIGWSSNHMIGDGEFVFQFIYAWSQYYQGKKSAFGPPTYEKYRTAPPDEHDDNPATNEFMTRYLQHLKVLYPMDQWMSMVGDVMSKSAQVDLMFTAHQIRQFRAIADLWPGRQSIPTTAQDAVSAYLITTLNRCFEVPITRMSSMLSYRGIKNPDNLKPGDWRIPGPLALGNTIFQAFTPQLSTDEASSIGAVALAIRKSIIDTRKYDHVKRIVAVSEPIWLRQSQEQREHKFWPDDGTFVINSMPKTDLSLFNFGYPKDRTRVVLYGAFAGYARFFPALPVKQVDGTWTSGESLWMWVRIPTNVRDKFLATIAEDLNSPGFPQNLVRREKLVQANAGKEKSRL